MSDEETLKTLLFYAEHHVEYRSLLAAEEGDQEPLARLIEQRGCLATPEARAFVAARLRGEKKTNGLKRTSGQISSDLGILDDVLAIQDQHGCTEYRAKKHYLNDHPDFNEETLKTILSRAKKWTRENYG
jgi:hypothetical protein